ncbi:MAG: hypothetical protein Ct9H300mP31_16940 [Acidimicrobiaceae bacterium]|nr:MAG: hypothetical protein Ct9H300mP31_16940 [Acidimicrobiaceae bacterium]
MVFEVYFSLRGPEYSIVGAGQSGDRSDDTDEADMAGDGRPVAGVAACRPHPGTVWGDAVQGPDERDDAMLRALAAKL